MQVDSSSAVITVNITSLQTSTIALAGETTFGRSVQFSGTAAEVNARLQPLQFITSSSERIEATIDHSLEVTATSEGESTTANLAITIVPGEFDDTKSLDKTAVAGFVAAILIAIIFGAIGGYILIRRRNREPKVC